MPQQVTTTPAPLTEVPAGSTLHYRIAVTNAAVTLASLLTGGVVPTIIVPTTKISPQSMLTYKFGFVDLQSEVDPSVVAIRCTFDGQTTPTDTLGFLVPVQPAFLRIPVDPSMIKVKGSGAGPTAVQVYLGITAIG
jgi:hypothetical protein